MGRRSKTDLALLAALAYVPFLLSSPGRVSADSKQALYLDPGRFLARAGDLWDPSTGAGTVPHQNLGYLFPTGPWFWLLDRLGMPDWVAQRLWWGTISLLAAVGARWLFRQLGTGRVGALAGAVVYGLTPYQLAFTARMSVLLLPWAALPWLVGATMRATRTRDWRAPALVALVLLAAGGINASSLLLVGVGPVLWVVVEALPSGEARRRALAALARIGALAVGISMWWLVGLRIQGANGLPVLQLTENVRTVAEASTPGDVLRGLGNWFFYGRDRVGYSLDQARAYDTDDLVVALSYAVPALALAMACLLRWSHRVYFALLVIIGTVLSVGSWPYDDPSPYGSVWRTFTSDTSLGLAFRNSPRAVPLVVLGLAGLLAGSVGAVRARAPRLVAGAAVVALVAGALLPVWQDGYLTGGLSRPEEIPAYWREAARRLDAGDHGTRVLEVPGSSFAAYRWGTTVDPITPALIDRPYVAREVLPSGTPPSVNLVAALDRRMQLGTFEAAGLPALARLLGVGTVSLRADLEQLGRFDTPPVDELWRALTHPRPDGLSEPVAFGPPGGDGTDPDLPSVALFDVVDPQPIVRTAPVAGSILLGGDGDGIVDAAAAGLVDGRSLVLEATPLSDEALDRALGAGARVILTDSHRRRIETWFYSLRDNRGPTEQAGETAPDPTGYDFRLDPFPGSTDDSRTVVEQVGGQVGATGEGGPERPEDRAARAVDGDPSTAWRVGGADPRGQRLTIRPDAPASLDRIQLVQPAASAEQRHLALVAVSVNGGAPTTVELGADSFAPTGQTVRFPRQDVREVTVEVLETAPPSPTPAELTPVGLAEVRLGDLVVSETTRLPVDLLDRIGSRLAGHALDIVVTRLRSATGDVDRSDEETQLDRRFELPQARDFSLRAQGQPVGEGAAAAGPTVTPLPPCRDDVVAVDGTPVPVSVQPVDGTVQVRGCAPIALSAGSHRVTTMGAVPAGVVIDRLVLSSETQAGAGGTAPGGPDAGAGSGTVVEVLEDDPTERHLRATTDGQAFWLVLGESLSSGWQIQVDGGSAGRQELVDGYANGWLISPDGAGDLAITLTWAPQRLVGFGFVVSAVTLAACAALLWRHRRRPVAMSPDLQATPSLVIMRPAAERLRPPAALLAGGATAVVALLVASPVVAAGAAAAAIVVAVVPLGGVVLAVLGPVALVVSRVAARPSLAWLAVLVLAADLIVSGIGVEVRARRRGRPPSPR